MFISNRAGEIHTIIERAIAPLSRATFLSWNHGCPPRAGSARRRFTPATFFIEL